MDAMIGLRLLEWWYRYDRMKNLITTEAGMGRGQKQEIARKGVKMMKVMKMCLQWSPNTGVERRMVPKNCLKTALKLSKRGKNCQNGARKTKKR